MVLAIPLSQSRVPGLIWADFVRMTEQKYGKASKIVETSKRIEVLLGVLLHVHQLYNQMSHPPCL